MALTVETGAIVANADSYISRADADTYATNHGNTSWASVSADNRDAALRYATKWIDGRYSWPGSIVDDDQVLAWPREGVTDAEGRIIAITEIPQVLKDAVCEAAFAHVAEALNEILSRGGEIESVKAGPVEVTFKSSAPPSRTFPFIDSILRILAFPRVGSTVTLVR